MLYFIESIFGSYTPVTYTETSLYWDSVNETFNTVTFEIIPAGLAGVDWPWISGVVLFAIFLYSFLRIVGGCICGK